MGFIRKLKSSSSVSSKSRRRSHGLARTLPGRLSQLPPPAVDVDAGPVSCTSTSLATGSFSPSGVFSITWAPRGRSPSPHSNGTASVESFSDGEGSYDGHGRGVAGTSKLSPIREVLVSRLPSTIFMRTADLPRMEEAAMNSRRSSFPELADGELVDHVHKASSAAPLPSMEDDSNESWVALDDGSGNRSPLADAAMEALVRAALDACMDRGMWTANGATAKLLKSDVWQDTLFLSCDDARPVPVPHARGSKGETDVLVWSGSWSHKYYGHELPAIRCEAIVNMSPRALADLLIDSSRVEEYNKMSIGRDDIMVLREDEKVVTKVSVAKSRPPMLGKTLMLRNLLHKEELPGGGDGAGYVIVSRAVTHANDEEAAEDPKVIRSEMLMGLNVIRVVEGEPDRCILINLNHLRSPMIPMMMAKRLGLSAAVNFINDIRKLC